jgi:CBS domain-containing protein
MVYSIKEPYMKVKDLLSRATRPPVTTAGDATIREAMKSLIENNIGCLIVIDDARAPIGIITERDIFRLGYKYNGKILHMKVSDHMTRKLIIGVPEDNIDYIAQVITQNRIRHIPILDETEQLCGIVSIGDVVKARMDLAEVHMRYLTEYITGRSHTKTE